MGELIDRRWHANGIDTVTAGGRMERPASVFRDWVMADGSAEPGRYHLYGCWPAPGRTAR